MILKHGFELPRSTYFNSECYMVILDPWLGDSWDVDLQTWRTQRIQRNSVMESIL